MVISSRSCCSSAFQFLISVLWLYLLDSNHYLPRHQNCKQAEVTWFHNESFVCPMGLIFDGPHGLVRIRPCDSHILAIGLFWRHLTWVISDARETVEMILYWDMQYFVQFRDYLHISVEFTAPWSPLANSMRHAKPFFSQIVHTVLNASGPHHWRQHSWAWKLCEDKKC